MHVKLTERERALVRAALECFMQVDEQCEGDLPDDLIDLATRNGDFEVLDLSENQDLTMRFA